MTPSPFDLVQRVADAVLFEGYVLYPYRASAAKNQYRWQFGVVAPRAPRDDGEAWFAQTECLIVPATDATSLSPSLSVRVRCLRPRSSDGEAWLEGVPCAIDAPAMPLPACGAVALGELGIAARLSIETEAESPFIKVRLRIENLEPWRGEFDRDRDAMLRRSLVGTHLLLAVEHGCFESLLEPSEGAQPVADRCRNIHTWPVLVGDRTQRRVMLSSPIVLYDFPAVANESQGDLCDAAEIDEILSLRILTLTEQEKGEARRTDPRARAILDRIDGMSPADLAALHGTMRSADFFNPRGAPAPEQAAVVVNGRRITRGTLVRLHPNRRADAMDMFLRDQAATVAGVYRDVDERVYVAVTIDADPAASLHESFGRFFYFDPTEVEPLDAAVPGAEGPSAASCGPAGSSDNLEST